MCKRALLFPNSMQSLSVKQNVCNCTSWFIKKIQLAHFPGHTHTISLPLTVQKPCSGDKREARAQAPFPSPLTPQPTGPQPWFLAPAVVQAVAVSSWYMGWEKSLSVWKSMYLNCYCVATTLSYSLPLPFLPSPSVTLSLCHPTPFPSLSFLLSLLQPGVLCATLPASAISVQTEATLQQVHPIRFHSIRDRVKWVQTAHHWRLRHRTIFFFKSQQRTWVKFKAFINKLCKMCLQFHNKQNDTKIINTIHSPTTWCLPSSFSGRL